MSFICKKKESINPSQLKMFSFFGERVLDIFYHFANNDDLGPELFVDSKYVDQAHREDDIIHGHQSAAKHEGPRKHSERQKTTTLASASSRS